jgi:glutathione S-transferase
MLKLFYAPHTCALASHIALEEAGAEYEAVRVDFKTNAQRAPEYLAVNPKGRVPSLATDLEDWFAFAQVQAFNSYLCSTVHVAHAHRMRAYRWVDDPTAIEAMKKKVPTSVGECFDLIERTMFQGPWVMGESYTICDPYLFTLAQWLEADGVDPARFPRVLDHRARMAVRPSVKKALAEELCGAS